MYRRDCGNRRESKKAAALRRKVFLSSVDAGRTISKYRIKLSSFREIQRIPSLMQDGKVKVTVVVSERGKEAVVAMHGKADFVGEGCLTGQPRRLATVRAMTESVIMRFDEVAVVRRAPRRAYLPKRPRGAPHRTLPSARLQIINGRGAVVRINDRGHLFGLLVAAPSILHVSVAVRRNYYRCGERAINAKVIYTNNVILPRRPFTRAR